MTQVDFYILDDSTPDARQLFACRLAEKAWQQGHRVYIHTGDPSLSAKMDELLWTFRQGSFIPHGLDADPATDDVEVHIGHSEEPQHHDEVLINLDREIPLFFSRFRRVAEVIDSDEENRLKGREHFRFYRDRGYPLSTHDIK